MGVFISLPMGELSLETRRKCAVVISVAVKELVNVTTGQLLASLRTGGWIGDERGFTAMDTFGVEDDLRSIRLVWS